MLELALAAFVDISPEETKQKSPFESFKDVTETTSSEATQFVSDVSLSLDGERKILFSCCSLMNYICIDEGLSKRICF